MKLVFLFTLTIAVMVTAGIGCLAIFEIVSVGLAMELLLKSLAAIGLIGASSVAIAALTGLQPAPAETNLDEISFR